MIFLHLILLVFILNSSENRDDGFAREHLIEHEAFTVYIGCLDFDVTDENIYAEYSKYGSVLNKMFHIRRDKENKSKGCAFVKYESFKEANSAILSTNGKILYGQRVCVGFARKVSCEERIDLYLENQHHEEQSEKKSENLYNANIPKPSVATKPKNRKPPRFSSFYTQKFDAMLSKLLFDRWLQAHFQKYGMHYCCETNPDCKEGIDSAAECISTLMKANKSFASSISHELDSKPLWIMWKYSWIHKPDSERKLVHSAEKQNEFVYSPEKIKTETPYAASTETDDKEKSSEKLSKPKDDSRKSSNVQKKLNMDFNSEFSKNFLRRDKYLEKKKNVHENKTPEKQPQKAPDVSEKESFDDEKDVRDCFGNKCDNEKQKAVFKQDFLDLKIDLMDPDRQGNGFRKNPTLRKWLVGHGLNGEGEREELLERIKNFRKHPHLKEPKSASDEIFKFTTIEAKIEKAQNRISRVHEIKLDELEPTALNVNQIRDDFVVDERVSNFLNELLMEIEVREECKGMNKKALQHWLVKESGCKSNSWLKVSKEELSNRIWTHFLKNSQTRKAEMKTLHEKKEKEKNIVAKYHTIFLSGLIQDGFAGLVKQVLHLSNHVHITTTKEEYVVSQAFGEQKKFIYKMKKLPYTVMIEEKFARLLLIYENILVFVNSPVREESRFQIHFIYCGETENDVETIKGKPFEIMHIFYKTDEKFGLFNTFQERFKKLSDGEVSVIEYYDNQNVRKD